MITQLLRKLQNYLMTSGLISAAKSVNITVSLVLDIGIYTLLRPSYTKRLNQLITKYESARIVQ